MEHRGPDGGAGRWDGSVWLGFRRLAVLDVDHRADQPMVDERSGVALVFNGEIYNYLELRAELEGAGHRFATTGDAEVLLQGYLAWGVDVFPRCNGMWAVAVRDPARPGVLLARDRFGEKPLHVARDGAGAWWFASELRTLHAAGALPTRLDLARVAAFLVLGDVEDPVGSYVAGVVQLPPGSTAILDEHGLGDIHRWYDPAAEVEAAADEPSPTGEQVRAALDASVALRLRADVPVGTSLSGGLDSGAVVASLRTVDPDRELHAFTASFPGRAIDEFERASLVAARHGVALHRVEPTAQGLLEDIDLLVDRQGGPIESPTAYAQWCVMRRAREEGITVLLDGQGADETWGGYPKHAGFALLGPDPRLVARTVGSWRHHGGLPRVDLAQAGALAVPGGARRALLRAIAARGRADLGPALHEVRLPDPLAGRWRGPVLRRSAAADLRRVILPRLLRYADRSSMAWSREVRLPFLDPEVVRLALRSDWSAGLAQGWTKLALRRAVSDRLPAEVVWRREKVAYETPAHEWSLLPGSQALLEDSREQLVALGLLSAGGARRADPWRCISLARFIDGYGLAP